MGILMAVSQRKPFCPCDPPPSNISCPPHPPPPPPTPLTSVLKLKPWSMVSLQRWLAGFNPPYASICHLPR